MLRLGTFTRFRLYGGHAAFSVGMSKSNGKNEVGVGAFVDVLLVIGVVVLLELVVVVELLGVVGIGVVVLIGVVVVVLLLVLLELVGSCGV